MAGPNYYHIVVACVVAVVLSPLMVQGQTLSMALPLQVCCTPTGNCTAGAAGLANVTGILSCVSPATGILSEVARGISNSNGTLAIVVSPVPLVGSVLTGVTRPGGVVPCVVTQTFQNINKTLCPVANLANATLVGVTTLVSVVPNLATSVIFAILRVINFIDVSTNANIGISI